MKAMKKTFIIASSFVLMILVPQVVLALAPGDPAFSVETFPRVGEVEAGGSVTFTLSAYSEEGFEGKIELELIDPPAGVTGTFEPNPVIVPGFDVGASVVTIEVASTVSEGEIELTIGATDPAGVVKDKTKPLKITVSGAAAPAPAPEPAPAPAPAPEPAPAPAGPGNPGPAQTVTTTITTISTTSTTVTTATTVEITTTLILTTKTSTINQKTTLDGFDQVNDMTYPLVTLAVVAVLISVAVIALRKPKP